MSLTEVKPEQPTHIAPEELAALKFMLHQARQAEEARKQAEITAIEASGAVKGQQMFISQKYQLRPEDKIDLENGGLIIRSSDVQNAS